MTDRELLELAARAAGIDLKHCPDDNNEWIYLKDGKFIPWNSLTDPGDALRLAVALGLEVAVHLNGSPRPYTVVYFNEGVYDHTAMEPHMSDPMASTCRAITRAAAEIGRAKT